jgi:hypothetical protein
VTRPSSSPALHPIRIFYYILPTSIQLIT